ncbi:MAG: LysR family transcriptional regulator, partial [Bdellovibrio sp.]
MSLVNHLDKLHVFKAVAESGKIHEAAKRLNVTQPSITRTIQNLENVVQRKLFYRSRNGVTLTDSGKLLFEFAQSLSKQLEDFEERLKFPKEEFAGLLKIGSYESLAEYFWPDFIASLKKTHPELKLSIKTNNISNNLKDLESGQLDMLVDAEPR